MIELIELAAIAAGHNPERHEIGGHKFITVDGVEWNPLQSDADAFRLMVALDIEVEQFETRTIAYLGALSSGRIPHADCKNKTTRLAITKAAAQLGRVMQK